MNDLIKNKIVEDKYISVKEILKLFDSSRLWYISAKEILELSDTSRFWYIFVSAFLIDINQTKNRLLRRASFKVMVENE